MEAATVVSGPAAAPEPGQLAIVRDRRWVVADVALGALEPDPLAPEPAAGHQHLVTLSAIDDDAAGEELRVVWELEPGARVVERAALPPYHPEALDDPRRLDAFLDAVRWGAVTSADARAVQAPFRAGISIEDYQLDRWCGRCGCPARACCCATAPARS